MGRGAGDAYDIYMKSLYALVSDRLEDTGGAKFCGTTSDAELAGIQKVAVRRAIQMIRDHGGAFVSDVVGLGKSYIGAGIVKHFARIEQAVLSSYPQTAGGHVGELQRDL